MSHKSDSSDDQDADSVSSEEESEQNAIKQAGELRKQLEASPMNYDLHVSYISVLKAAGDLLEVRNAREAMHSKYPLTEALWMDWISDEARIATSAHDKEAIAVLYSKSLNDYESVALWTAYAQFLEALLPAAPSSSDSASDPSFASWAAAVERVRKMYEDALSGSGLNIAEGGQLWDSFRAFESRIFDLLPEGFVAETGGRSGTKWSRAEQLERVQSLFRRQLGLPLLGLEEAYESFKAWQEAFELPSALTADLEKKYKAALGALAERKVHEELVSNSANLEGWLAYAAFEEGKKDPSRVQSVYERALKTCCLSPDLWIKYTSYLDHELKVASVGIKAYERAVRNCYWCGALWVGYLRALERYGRPDEDVTAVFERALVAGVTSPHEFIDIFNTYCDFRRRKVSGPSDDQHVALLQAALERATKYVNQYFPDANSDQAFERYHAAIEADTLQNIEAARQIWEGILKVRGKEANFWVEYIDLERHFGSKAVCRSLYKRALYVVFEGVEMIASGWMQFERQYGTLEQFESALSRVNARIAQVQERRRKDFEEAQPATQERGDRRKGEKGGPSAGPADGKGQGRGQRPGRGGKEMAAPAGRGGRKRGLGYREQKEGAGRQADRREFVFTEGDEGDKDESSPPSKRKRVDDGAERMDLEHPQPAAPASKPPELQPAKVEQPEAENNGPATGQLEAEAGPAGGQSGSEEGGQTKPVYQHVPGVPEPKTVFVSQLDKDITKAQLHGLFVKYGKIKDIRVTIRRSGQCRGIAYVEFHDEESARNACELNGQEFQGRKITVAISCPPKRDSADPRQQRGPQRGFVQARGPPPAFNAPVRKDRRTQLSLVPRQLAGGRPTSFQPATESSESGAGAGEAPEQRQGPGRTDSPPVAKGPSLSNEDFKKMMYARKP